MARRNTPERILVAALELFNDEGVANVSTNHIADATDISPGNLYYHFRNKEQIINRLFDDFEDEFYRTLPVPDQAPDLEQIWLFLHLMFELIGRYRFIYHDLVYLVTQNRSLARRFRHVLNRKREAGLAICELLHRDGVLLADSPKQLRALAEQIALTATFWLSHSRIRSDQLDADQAARGVAQLLLLTAPYLRSPERQHLLALADQY